MQFYMVGMLKKSKYICEVLDKIKLGGRTPLPKFKFSAKFLKGLLLILQLQITKIQNLIESDVQNYFDRQMFGCSLAPLWK